MWGPHIFLNIICSIFQTRIQGPLPVYLAFFFYKAKDTHSNMRPNTSSLPLGKQQKTLKNHSSSLFPSPTSTLLQATHTLHLTHKTRENPFSPPSIFNLHASSGIPCAACSAPPKLHPENHLNIFPSPPHFYHHNFHLHKEISETTCRKEPPRIPTAFSATRGLN